MCNVSGVSRAMIAHGLIEAVKQLPNGRSFLLKDVVQNMNPGNAATLLKFRGLIRLANRGPYGNPHSWRTTEKHRRLLEYWEERGV